VAPEDSEPGAPLPSTDPLLAYYRGFCREKLGQSGAADYAAASQMPLLYIFPSEPDEITVLRAALAVNASDASAHFLLGTLLFSKGIVDPAFEEWKLAESLNPKIPSLQASMGRVLLEVKKQPAEAAAEFQRGLQMEPSNAALYLGLNQAMQRAGKTPSSARRDDEGLSGLGKHAGTPGARSGGGPPRERPQRRSERGARAPLPAPQRGRSATPTTEIIPSNRLLCHRRLHIIGTVTVRHWVSSERVVDAVAFRDGSGGPRKVGVSAFELAEDRKWRGD